MDSCPDIFHTNDHNSPQAQLRNGKVEDKDISMQKSDAINNTMPTNELLPESDDADPCMDSHFSPSFVSRLGSSDSNIDVNVDIIHNSGYKFRSDEEENPLNNNYVDHFSRSKIDVKLNISRNSSSEGEDPLLDNDDVNHLHYDMTEVISEGSSALEFVASLEESDLELKGLGGRLSIPYGDEAVFDFGNEAIRNNLVEKRGFTMCGCKDAIEVVNHGDMTYGTHQPLSSSCLQVEVERGHAIWNDCKDAMKTKCIVDAIQSRNATDGSNSIDSVQCKDLATRNHASKIRDDVPPSLVFCLPSKHTSKSTSVPSTISIHKKNEVEDSSIAMYKTSCALNPNFIENEGGTPSMQPRDEESATPSSSIFTSRTLSYDGIFVSNSNPTVFTFSSELSPKISSPRKPDCSKQDKGSRQHEASPPKQKPRRKSNIEIDRDGSTHRFHPLYWIMALSFMIGIVTLLAVFTLNSKDDDNPNLIWLDGDTAVYDIVAESENESNGDEDGSSNLPSSFPSLPLMNSVVYSRMPTTEPNVDSVLTQETAGTTNFPLNKTEPNENDIVVATINATINLASPDHLDTNTAANITAPTNLKQKSNVANSSLSGFSFYLMGDTP